MSSDSLTRQPTFGPGLGPPAEDFPFFTPSPPLADRRFSQSALRRQSSAGGVVNSLVAQRRQSRRSFAAKPQVGGGARRRSVLPAADGHDSGGGGATAPRGRRGGNYRRRRSVRPREAAEPEATPAPSHRAVLDSALADLMAAGERDARPLPTPGSASAFYSEFNSRLVKEYYRTQRRYRAIARRAARYCDLVVPYEFIDESTGYYYVFPAYAASLGIMVDLVTAKITCAKLQDEHAQGPDRQLAATLDEAMSAVPADGEWGSGLKLVRKDKLRRRVQEWFERAVEHPRFPKWDSGREPCPGTYMYEVAGGGGGYGAYSPTGFTQQVQRRMSYSKPQEWVQLPKRPLESDEEEDLDDDFEEALGIQLARHTTQRDERAVLRNVLQTRIAIIIEHGEMLKKVRRKRLNRHMERWTDEQRRGYTQMLREEEELRAQQRTRSHRGLSPATSRAHSRYPSLNVSTPAVERKGSGASPSGGGDPPPHVYAQSEGSGAQSVFADDDDDFSDDGFGEYGRRRYDVQSDDTESEAPSRKPSCTVSNASPLHEPAQPAPVDPSPSNRTSAGPSRRSSNTKQSEVSKTTTMWHSPAGWEAPQPPHMGSPKTFDGVSASPELSFPPTSDGDGDDEAPDSPVKKKPKPKPKKKPPKPPQQLPPPVLPELMHPPKPPPPKKEKPAARKVVLPPIFADLGAPPPPKPRSPPKIFKKALAKPLDGFSDAPTSESDAYEIPPLVRPPRPRQEPIPGLVTHLHNVQRELHKRRKKRLPPILSYLRQKRAAQRAVVAAGAVPAPPPRKASTPRRGMTPTPITPEAPRAEDDLPYGGLPSPHSSDTDAGVRGAPATRGEDGPRGSDSDSDSDSASHTSGSPQSRTAIPVVDTSFGEHWESSMSITSPTMLGED